MTNLSMDMGYQRENLNWPRDLLVFGMGWTSMIWKEKFNSQQREFENTISTIKSHLIDRANNEFYKSHL